MVGKYANSVYKSICDALTVKIGNFAMAPTVLQKRPHFAKVQNHHSSNDLIAKSSSLSFVFVAKNCATKYIWRNLTSSAINLSHLTRMDCINFRAVDSHFIFPQKCRGDFPVVKCTYCRSEFQQER